MTANDRVRFITASIVMKRLYQANAFTEGINCHVAARAVAPFIQARVNSGHVFAPYVEAGKAHVVSTEHSWIQLCNGWILDLKPVGMIAFSPIAVDTKPGAGVGHYTYMRRRVGDEDFPKPARTKQLRLEVSTFRQKIADVMQTHELTTDQIVGYYKGLY